MYRVILIVGGALTLAACSSTPDWMSLDALKPAPIMDTVRFESEPPGAEAKTSNGQNCRTPCALALPVNAPLTVTFTLNGYQPDSETVEPLATTGAPTQLQPNPVVVHLAPAAPPKVVKKPAPKKKTASKPAAKPTAKSATKPATKPAAKPAATTASAPAPMTAAPVQQQAPAPWPSTPAPQR